jgi:hypothetical protein
MRSYLWIVAFGTPVRRYGLYRECHRATPARRATKACSLSTSREWNTVGGDVGVLECDRIMDRSTKD